MVFQSEQGPCWLVAMRDDGGCLYISVNTAVHSPVTAHFLTHISWDRYPADSTTKNKKGCGGGFVVLKPNWKWHVHLTEFVSCRT